MIKLDPYQKSKARIQKLYNYVSGWQDNDVCTKKLDIWSIKKILALDYYAKPYVDILRSKNFKKWYYVDLFSGSGMMRIDNRHNFPGSSIIPLLNSPEYRFHKYFLADSDRTYVEALNNRIKKIPNYNKLNIDVKHEPFENSVKQIFSGQKPENWMDVAYLVFLDPFGFRDISWNDMERILKSGAVDIIFTFMTFAVSWNRSMKQSLNSLNDYFGDKEWVSLSSQEDLVKYYCSKIEKMGFNKNYKTFTIDILQTGGRRYNLILASQSTGAANIFRYIKKIMATIDTKLLEDAFSVCVGKKLDLDSFN